MQDSISYILCTLVDGTISHPQEKELVRICSQISFKYLKKRHSKISKLIVRNNVSLEEASIEAILPLFIEKEDKPGQLKRYFIENPELLNDEDLTRLAIFKIVWNLVEQHIATMLSEADPFFSKIKRGLEYQIEKKGFSKLAYFGNIYIVKNNEVMLNGKVLHTEDFDEMPFYSFCKADEYFLDEVFNYLIEETCYFPAIPFNALIKKIQELTLLNWSLESHSFNDNTVISDINVREIVQFARKSANEKLGVYYRKQKINDQELEAFKKAINLMCDDLIDGGISRGLIEYLELGINGNFTKYYNILDYMKKIIKDSVAKELIIE
ncbi:MAG: hypothetical protein ACM3RX_08045 [Methanococcaceae archaeon]